MTSRHRDPAADLRHARHGRVDAHPFRERPSHHQRDPSRRVVHHDLRRDHVLSATNDWARLAVIAGAFVVTVGVAYWKFAVRMTAPTALPAGPPDQISPVDPGLPARVDRLERRLDDLRKALAD
jgi:hypothetical protein